MRASTRLRVNKGSHFYFYWGLVMFILTLSTSALGCSSYSAIPKVIERRDNIDERFSHFESDILVPAPHPRASRKNPIWPNATVVYQYCGEFTDAQKSIIGKVMEEITEKTCIQFKENVQASAKTGEDFICIRKGEEAHGCNSYVGRKGGLQVLNLDPAKGCINHGTVTHQFGHALGLWHEHARYDRDDYIDINWNNVKAGAKGKLAPYAYYASKVRNWNTPYDYQSVMHHSAYTFAQDHTVATIIPKVNFEIGQRDGLSSGDVTKLKTMYNITLIHCLEAAKNVQQLN